MNMEFSQRFVERHYENLEEAIDSLGSQQVTDDLVDLSKIRFNGLSILVYKGKEYHMTRPAFVQLLGLVDLTWKEVKEEDPTEVTKALQSRLHHWGKEVMLRKQSGAVQAVLSPRYTPITNVDILKAAQQSMDLSKLKVTVYRGTMRLTGVSDSVKFQPEAGDIISGGWEVTHNEFGKGALTVNQFLLRLICTNGAVIGQGDESYRYVHKGWGREELLTHLGSVGHQMISRMGEMDASLRRATQKRMGVRRYSRLFKEVASPLGRNGILSFQKSVTPESSVYDVYNYITFASQSYRLNSRRKLEVLAGGLLE